MGTAVRRSTPRLTNYSTSVWILFVGFHLGPIFAVAQTIATTSMRALASATVLLTATCFGQGVGPFTVGYLNDLLQDPYGARRCAIRS